MTGTPRLSVLMTVYNGGPFLAPAIQSALSSSISNLELVVVDNVSTDGSREWLRNVADPRLRLIENTVNLGQTGALQVGLEACRAPFIARLDADDLCEPDRFSAQLDAFTRFPNTVLVGGQALFIDATDQVIGRSSLPTNSTHIAAIMTVTNPFIHSAVMFDRAAALRVGGYDNDFLIAQDYALWSALLRAGGSMINLSQPVCRLRLHAAQVTGSGLRTREAPEALRITALNQGWIMGESTMPDDNARAIQALWQGPSGPTDPSSSVARLLAAPRLNPEQRAVLALTLAGGHGPGHAYLRFRLILKALWQAPTTLGRIVFIKALRGWFLSLVKSHE